MLDMGITISLYNRAIYTKYVLKKLAACDLIERFPIYISIDTSEVLAEILDIVDQTLPQAIVEVNHPRLGCGGNIRKCVEWGLSKHPVSLHIEDDIILATDALIYFANAAELNFKDKTVFSVCGYNRDTIKRCYHDLYLYQRVNSWYPWGVLWFKDRYEQIKDRWINEPWDINVKSIVRANGWVTVLPLISRVINIGAENGAHTPSPTWHSKKHIVTNFADDFLN